MREVLFDKSYVILGELTKGKLTAEKLAKFSKENPDLISVVSAEKIKASVLEMQNLVKSKPKVKKFMESNKIPWKPGQKWKENKTVNNEQEEKKDVSS